MRRWFCPIHVIRLTFYILKDTSASLNYPDYSIMGYLRIVQSQFGGWIVALNFKARSQKTHSDIQNVVHRPFKFRELIWDILESTDKTDY